MIPALHATLARLTTCCHRKTPAVSAGESPNQLALATISTSTVAFSSVPVAFRAIAAETSAKATKAAAHLPVISDSDNLERNLDRMIHNIRTSGIWNEEGGDIAPFAMMSMLQRPLLIFDAKHSDHDQLLRTADMSRQAPIILERSCDARRGGGGYAHYAAMAPIPFRGGWRAVPIRYDGDCFYCALIAARDRREDKDISSTEVQALRQQLADYIAAHRADYLPFAAQDNRVSLKRPVSDQKIGVDAELDRKVAVPWVIGI